MILAPKTFYIMRHGQSFDNASGLISGAGSDPHLTLKGYKQAEIASLTFAKLNPRPVRIISSGLVRAHVTAQVVTGAVEIIQDPDLNERHLGELDGKISEAEQKIMKILPGEETSLQHATRVIDAINRHLRSDELTLFVCHGGTIRRVLEGLKFPKDTDVGNAEIYGLKCYTENDVSRWEIEQCIR